MSEKRLTYDILMNNYYQIREVDGNGYCRRLSPTGIIDLLNEQQATINKLKKARDESDKFIIKKGLEAEFLNWVVENDE